MRERGYHADEVEEQIQKTWILPDFHCQIRNPCSLSLYIYIYIYIYMRERGYHADEVEEQIQKTSSVKPGNLSGTKNT